MEYKDYYKVLGVDKKSTKDEIKKAYRKLAMKFHPDRNPGDKSAEEKFKEINEAYQVLSNDEQRQRYDQLGSSYNQWQQSGARGDFNWEDWFSTQPGARQVHVDMGDLGDFENIFGGGFSDFFNMIFGGGAAQRTGRRTYGAGTTSRIRPRYEYPVTISLQEAYQGTERSVQVDGRNLRVKIPAGAKNGTKVRMSGAGPSSSGGQSSDLFLVIQVSPDERFERKGDDLYTDVKIDLYKAVLGGEANVETPSGRVILTIPAGTQPDQTFRLSGRGMPKLRNPKQHGDLYAQVKVQIPTKLNKEQRALFEKLSNS